MRTSSPLTKPLIEPLPQVGSKAINIKSFQKRCVDFHWHFHPEYELIYIKRGQGVCYMGSSVFPYQSGDWFLVGANLPHAFGSYEKQRSGAEWTVLHFLPDFFGSVFWAMTHNREIKRLLKESDRGIRFNFSQSMIFENLLKQMEAPRTQHLILAYFLELIGRLAEGKSRKLLNRSIFQDQKQIHSRLEKALAYIQENSNDPDLKQVKVSGYLKLSPASFCQMFKQGTGKSYTVYLHELRIARACTEILHSTKTISTIAFDVGFNNLSNFHRCFLRYTGQSPLKYRSTRGGTLDSVTPDS